VHFIFGKIITQQKKKIKKFHGLLLMWGKKMQRFQNFL